MAAQTASLQDLENPWLRSYFLNRLSLLDRERSSFFGTWKELSLQFAPRRGRFLGGANDWRRGARKDQRVIDNTGILAARVLASGMMAGISSPARPWFRLRLALDELNRQPGVRQWLDHVQQVLLKVFKDSNLYNCLHTLYGELGIFGTAALWVDEDREDVVRGYTLTVGEYWLAQSRRMAVDTLYRTLLWTVRQIVDTFGRDAVSPGLRANYDSGLLDLEYEIVHAIEPNPNASASAFIPRSSEGALSQWTGRLSSQLPFRSVWFERGQQGERTLLAVSGYQDFPCMAPRWDVVGTDTWGSGPGWTALGDSLQLQSEQRDKLQAIQKMHKPPMVAPPSLRNELASLTPGGVTYVADPAGQTFRSAVDVRLDLSHLSADIQQVQERIRSAFFADVFLSLLQTDRPQMTAEEVKVRYEEKLLLLGPVLERVHDELLDPLVKRVFNIAARHGLIPPPPHGIDLAGLQIEFVSVLAQAQKSVGTGAIERFWQFGMQIGAARPEAMDRLNTDGTMEAYADMTGVPASVLVDLDVAQKAREARARAAAQQAALADAGRIAAIGKTASDIDVGGGRNAVQAAIGA